MTPRQAILCGILYRVEVADNQVIFTEEICIHGRHCVFALERPPDLNQSPGIWWLTHLDSTSSRIPASHISKALEYCEREFGASFEPYRGGLHSEITA